VNGRRRPERSEGPALSFVVPCHRVIRSNGALTGFGGGIERKRWLLQHEGALLL
jgi:methylated-DNA-[protein]-cysteine S-methyltransferase